MKEYLYPNKDEFMDSLVIVLALSFMFSLLAVRFSKEESMIISFLLFFCFLATVFFGRLVLMKYASYRQGFEIHLQQIYFNRYGLRRFEKLSYDIDRVSAHAKFAEQHHSKDSFKGIPLTLLSLFLYVLTLGLLIFPSLWTFKKKKIPHIFTGSQYKYEGEMLYLRNVDVTDYRFSKSLFAGFAYYALFALFMKVFLDGLFDLYGWLMLSLCWIALITLLPIMGTEGYELWIRNRFAWSCAFVVVFFTFLAVLAFNSAWYTLVLSFLAVCVGLFVVLYKKVSG